MFPELKDDPENIVLLTAKEHYLAHALLCRIYDTGREHFQMCAAFLRFCSGNANDKFYGSGRLYEKYKADWVAYMSEFHRTRERKPETYEKIIAARRLHNNLKHTDETKEKLRLKAKEQFANEENKKAMSEKIKTYFETHPGRGPKGHKFGPHSEERKQKTLEALVNSEKWHERYYNVECVETGERFSQSLLAKQLNIPRHKLKPLIVKEENINGKHYKFRRSEKET